MRTFLKGPLPATVTSEMVFRGRFTGVYLFLDMIPFFSYTNANLLLVKYKVPFVP